MQENLALDALLRWYVDAGVDETIGDAPLDRYRAPAPRPAPPDSAPRPRPAAPVAAAAPVPAAPAEAPASRAAHAAAAAASLHDLRLALESFDGCALKRTASTTVFGDGNPEAPVMVIGEAPGAEEDRQGLPFVGASGKLLDRMLASIGLDRRTGVYITNVVCWRPPGNRKPTPGEVEMCLPFIERHIELVDPEVLILFGGAAASALLARNESISALRGRWHDYATPRLPRPVPALATYHPAFLLRTPSHKREAWRDLLAVRRRLDRRA